jgi:hypothetical protein
LVCFWFVFGRFSARGVQKHHTFFCKKSKEIDKVFDVSSSSAFLFCRVFGCFSAMGVQRHYKNLFTNKIVSKSFYKKFDQKPKTDFFLGFLFITFLAFLGEGSSKQSTSKNITPKNPAHSLFVP